MDDENFRALARMAWELDRALQAVQKILMQMFFDEFVKLDHAALEKRIAENADLPF